jgi:RHS repeat-associated protein
VDGGYIENGVYHYYLTDHLGNNRVVANQSGTVIQRNHYYPFGMAFAEGTVAEQSKQPYKYNGKELDQMHGLNLYDYSARYYESAIGRFTTVDPLAEKYYSISPYVYCANNPLKYVDLKGDSLTLVGQQRDLQAVVDVHNDRLKGYYDVTVNGNGLVSMAVVPGADMGTMTKSQQNYADILNKVVNGSDGMTTINVVNNSEDVLIGLASTATIDIGDMQRLGEGNVGSGTTLMHEIWEQYKLQVGNVPINAAHRQAIGVENIITGQQSQGAFIHYDYQNPRAGVTSNSGTITIPFRNNAPTLIRFRNNNIVPVIIR